MMNYFKKDPTKELKLIIKIALALYFASSLIAMAPMSIAAGLTLVLYAIQLIRGQANLNDPVFKHYNVWSLKIALSTALSLIAFYFSPLEINSESLASYPANDLIGFLKLWHLLIPIAVTSLWIQLDQRQRSKVLGAYLLAFVVISAIGFQESFTGWPYHRVLSKGVYHAQAFLKFHLSFASILPFPFFILFHPAFKSLPKRLSIATWTVAVSALLFTFSRGLWIGLPIGILVYAILELKKPKAKIGIVVGILVVAAGALQIPAIQTRLNQLGITPRLTLWKVHFELFKERPVFGVGFRKNTDFVGLYNKHFPIQGDFLVSHAHSNWIEVLTGTGIIGLTAWLAWWVWIFRQTWNLGPKTTPSGFRRSGFLAAFIVFHINGLTQVNFWEGKVSHSWGITIGLLLGELILLKRDKNQEIYQTGV